MNPIRPLRFVTGLPFVAGGLSLLLAPALRAGSRDVTHSLEVVPELATYAQIDLALDQTEIQPLGGEWRYLPGTAAPSEKREWTEEDFDESAWLSGSAPFTFGMAESGEGEVSAAQPTGTTVPEFGDGVTSVYLRAVLKLAELNRYERIAMEFPVEGGFVFYLNGDSTKRVGAGDPKLTPTFDATASLPRLATTLPVPTADLTRTIRGGANQLAVHGFLYASESARFGIFPTIRGTFLRSPDFDAQRREQLYEWLQAAEDEGRVARTAYLEGRCAQRAGRFEEAIGHFTNALARDPASSLLWERRIACQRELGTLETFDAECRAAFGPETNGVMLDAWTRVALEELGRTPAQIAAAIPGDMVLRPGSLIHDTVWLATRLENGQAIRLDCGRDRERETEGGEWSRDRFYSPASVARTSLSDGTTPRTWSAGRSVRVNTRAFGDLTPTYRVPLPSGTYELRLSFVGNDGEECAVGDALFDVVAEGCVLLANYDPVLEAGRRGRAEHSFPLRIADGFLELDLLPRTSLVPWIAGVELTPLDDTAYLEHARAWVETSSTPSALPWVQLGEALWLTGDTRGALEAFERAEPLDDFQPEHAARLGALRVALLPDVLSFASGDDLARHHAAAVESHLSAIQGAGSPRGMYLEARAHQQAGRIEDALGLFEELVASGDGDLEPLQGMAECLIAAGLPDHALDLLNEGIAGASGLPPEILGLWITLNLEVLERDPWDLIAELADMGAPDRLVVVPHSEWVPRAWRMSTVEPPSTSWSRSTFDPASWSPGVGAFGTGHSPSVHVRTPWTTDGMYARHDFHLDSTKLLFPHVSVYTRDAVNVYLNGTSVAFVGIGTEGYIDMPARKAGWVEGENVLGVHAFNSTGAGSVDAGIVQPLGDLMWISRSLEEDGILRLNCGGPEVTTADGTVWAADRFYGWAKPLEYPETEPRLEIEDTADDVLYETMRFFYADVISTWYQVPLPDGMYRIRMHFAEIDDEVAEGERVFQVGLEDYLVVEDLDIMADVGRYRAYIHQVDMEVNDGWLDLRLFDPDDVAVISALEIEPIRE